MESESPSSSNPADPGLAVVIGAWPTLAESAKAGILAMIRVAGGAR